MSADPAPGKPDEPQRGTAEKSQRDDATVDQQRGPSRERETVRAEASDPAQRRESPSASAAEETQAFSSSGALEQLSIERFVECLSTSGLMSADEINAIVTALPPEAAPRDALSLAGELVRRSKLTEYQANLLCQGQARGLLLGSYVVLDELGAGGMGVVVKAQHRRMKRVVALKLLPTALTNSPTAIERFHREVEAAAKLTHPNIVAAFDAGEADGTHFLVMEYVEGDNLSQYVRQHGPLPLGRAIDILLQVARGLDHAHRCGVVHRDIKPANLLLDREGRVKILDMGLARIMQADAESEAQQEALTQTGRLMGTVDYMAPEQALDVKRADHRADIYSLGCTLYYLLTGRPISPDGTVTKKLLWHQTHPVPSLREACAGVPASLEALFQRMLAKRPEERPQSMAEVITGLEACGRELPDYTSSVEMGWHAPLAGHAATDTVVKTATTGPQSDTVGDQRRATGAMRSKPVKLGLAAAAAVGLIGIGAGLWAWGGAFFWGGDNRPHATLPTQPPPAAAAAGALPTEKQVDPAEAARKKLLEWVFSLDGVVTVVSGAAGELKELRRLDDVPSDTFIVDGLNFEGADLRDEDLGPLREAQRLRRLVLRRTSVGDVGLDSVAALTALSSLDLSRTDVTDRGLARLRPLVQLTELNLQGTAIGDAGVEQLADFSKLQKLYLGDTGVTDEGLARLATMKTLRNLGIEGTRVTGEGVAALKAALPAVDLAWTPPDVDRQVARHILNREGSVELTTGDNARPIEVDQPADVPIERFELQAIRLSGRRDISDADLKRLAGLEHLQSLSLDGTSITSAGLDNLHGLKSLKNLDLGKLELSQESVAALSAALPGCKISWQPVRDREVAAWALRQGAELDVQTADGQVVEHLKEQATLPRAEFRLRAIRFAGNQALVDDDLAQLAALGQLESLDLSQTPISDAGLGHLIACRSIRELNLARTKITDEGIHRLNELATLRQLHLEGTPVTDAGLAALRSLDDLAQLSLAQTSVTDQGVAHLARLTNLSWLSLADTAIGDAAVEPLGKLARLAELRLEGTQISDAGIEELARKLPDCRVTGNPPNPERLAARWVLEHGGGVTLNTGEVRQLSELPRGACTVETIDLKDATGINADGLRRLAACAALGELDLSGTRIADADLDHLAGIKSLRRVSLARTTISDRGLAALAGLSELESLDLSGTRVSGTGLGQLAELPALKRLLLGEARVSNAGLKVVKQLPHLRQLDLSYALDLTDQSLADWPALKAIESLNLRGTRLGDAAVAQLAACEKLKQLDLSSTQVTDAGLAALARLKQLASLQLYSTALTDSSLSVLSQMRTLKALNVAKTRITPESLATLKTQMPNCQITP